MNLIPANGIPNRRSGADLISRAAAALVAGTIAIVLNTLILNAARLVPLATGNGGLLRFLVKLTGGAFPAPAGAIFHTGFHIVIGLAMALLYAFVLEPWMRVPSWLRGVFFATAVWLINALIVLPAIGEGIAGSRDLTLAGMLWFAGAHTLFFLVLAILFAQLRSARGGAGEAAVVRDGLQIADGAQQHKLAL